MSDNTFILFVTYFFGGPCTQSQSTHTRWVAPNQGAPRDGFDEPLEWHVDAQPHGAADFTINLWTPLQDCGVTRPGIQAAILPIGRAQALAGFDGDSGEFDMKKVYRLVADPSVLGGVTSFAPVMRVGDVFFMTHWTVHATYATLAMTERRLSAELRFSYPNSRFPESSGHIHYG